MELVTVPATPNYQKQAWRLFFSKVEMLCAVKGKQVSEFFDLSRMLSNGLHIHISKDKFFETGKHTNRFLALLNQEGSTAIDFIQPFTGRPRRYSDHTYCSIASGYYEGRTTARRIKVSSVDNRATAHSSNPHTIEVRMFQGIFDINHIIRCIEFTMAVFYYSAEAPYGALFGRRFKDGFQKFVLGQPGYKSIKKEFKPCA